jgi:hypothetical protein
MFIEARVFNRKMCHNPREHICELFDFECMRKNDRNVYM